PFDPIAFGRERREQAAVGGAAECDAPVGNGEDVRPESIARTLLAHRLEVAVEPRPRDALLTSIGALRVRLGRRAFALGRCGQRPGGFPRDSRADQSDREDGEGCEPRQAHSSRCRKRRAAPPHSMFLPLSSLLPRRSALGGLFSYRPLARTVHTIRRSGRAVKPCRTTSRSTRSAAPGPGLRPPRTR